MTQLNLQAIPKIAFVNDYINARMQIEALGVLYIDMQRKWDGLMDQQGNNLVVGVKLAGTKTDACKTYATELITRYLSAHGLTLQNWSPASLMSQSRDREGGLAAIGVQDYNNHGDLFSWVVSFVIGIDPILAKASLLLVNGEKQKAELHLLFWLLSKYKLITAHPAYDHLRAPDLDAVTDGWPELIHATVNNTRDTSLHALMVLADKLYDPSIINAVEQDELLTIVLYEANKKVKVNGRYVLREEVSTPVVVEGNDNLTRANLMVGMMPKYDHLPDDTSEEVKEALLTPVVVSHEAVETCATESVSSDNSTSSCD